MAYFDYVVKYQIKAECSSPFRTGAADGDREEILIDRYGNPFIQGTSIAGALRSWIAENRSEQLAEELFGSEEVEGRLIISDGNFDKDVQLNSRPRLQMDTRTGTAEEGKKFDVKYVSVGSVFTFLITCLGKREESDWSVTEEVLSALNAGQIRLGALKSSGFGKVSLSVKKQIFDLKKESDRNKWLKDQEQYEPVKLKPVKEKQKVTFLLSGEMKEVLVKDTVHKEKGRGDGKSASVTVNIKENSVPVIPGSSVRGVVRSRVESIAIQLGLDQKIIEDMFGCASEGRTGGRCGRVQFEDVQLKMIPGTTQEHKASRIRNNKFTGGVIRKALFIEESVSASVQIRITMEEEPAECLLMMYALRDLGIRLYGLGSGYAIGRGYIDAEELKVTLPDERMIKMEFEEGYVTRVNEEGQMVLRAWNEQMGELGK